ncbi:MAG: ABC transporter ATP-binding protein [Christensenellales bacterium]
MVLVMVTQSAAAAQRIEEVLEEQPDITGKYQKRRRTSGTALLVTLSMSAFAYQQRSGKPVLSDIDLHIKSGETIGVIGGRGCGKSSLMSLISRLYDASAGTVRVGGIDVRHYDMEVLRNEVAVVLQNNVLFSGTILDNLRWGNEDATEAECEAACRAPVPMSSSSGCRSVMRHGSSAAAPMCLAVRNSGSASPGPC